MYRSYNLSYNIGTLGSRSNINFAVATIINRQELNRVPRYVNEDVNKTFERNVAKYGFTVIEVPKKGSIFPV